MKLGMRVSFGPGHIVLDGDPALPPPKGHTPAIFGRICCGQIAGWIKMPLGMESGLGPGDFVLNEDPAPMPPMPKWGQSPNFSAMSIVAKRLDGLRCHLVWR